MCWIVEGRNHNNICLHCSNMSGRQRQKHPNKLTVYQLGTMACSTFILTSLFCMQSHQVYVMSFHTALDTLHKLVGLKVAHHGVGGWNPSGKLSSVASADW